MTFAFQLVSIIVLASLLSLLTGRIVKYVEHLCHLTHLAQFAISSVLIALVTSLPELVISLSSSFHHYSTLAFGNAIGSNMVNIALVMGVTAIAANPLRFLAKTEAKNVFSPTLLTFLPFVFLANGTISRLEGLLLVVAYPFYLHFFLPSIATPINRHQLPSSITIHLAKLIGLLIVLVFTAEALVTIARSLALGLNLPPIFVGLFIVAIGTSLPELIFNLQSIRHHHPSLAIGNVIGSNIANATLVVGLSALIFPISFTNLHEFILPGIEYFFIILLFVVFVRTKNKIQSWEGVILVLLFIYYSAIELLIK